MTLLSLLLTPAFAQDAPARADYDVVLTLFGVEPFECDYPGRPAQPVDGHLVATVVSDSPELSSAWVVAQGVSAGYGPGDLIPGLGRVVAIEADGVRVESEGRSMVLVR